MAVVGPLPLASVHSVRLLPVCEEAVGAAGEFVVHEVGEEVGVGEPVGTMR
jgi:hypothetical protein